MRTISYYVNNGIKSLQELKEALYLAVQLEFSTIPPYLCAQWSIYEDPDRVEGLLHHIVGQEMNHMALAGNLLSAIGGVPRVARRDFLPKYPLKYLPGGIAQERPVHLRPLSFDQLEVFMQIENPEYSPVAYSASDGPASIGQFYDEIIAGFNRVKPKLSLEANVVPVILYRPVGTIDDAIAVITRIKIEGEGLQDAPEEPNFDGSAYAHYYLFKEVYRQRRLVKTPGGWEFSGSEICFPKVRSFHRSKRRHELQREFRMLITDLLFELEGCWRGDSQFNVSTMFRIHYVGRSLIKLGIRPEFIWLQPAIAEARK
jgi:hypothetical protein